jgi:tRNA A37 threonylcarbamoyltransferase TsaD
MNREREEFSFSGIKRAADLSKSNLKAKKQPIKEAPISDERIEQVIGIWK